MIRWRMTPTGIPNPRMEEPKLTKWQKLFQKAKSVMTASKRKINSLVNGLGSKSTVSLPPPIDEDDINNDRKRLRLSGDLISLESPSTMHYKSMSLATAGQSDVVSVTYAPWHREAFLNRLRTYTSLHDWADKPAAVNEVEWAKRGWVNKGQERLRCVSCNVELVVKLNKRTEQDGKEVSVLHAPNIDKALVKKYAEMIVTSHSENCLWRQRGCDDTIFKIQFSNAIDSLEALRKRYDELVAMKDVLPLMHNLRFPKGYDINTAMSYLPKHFFDVEVTKRKSNEEEEVNLGALAMALFGWQRRVVTNPHVDNSMAQCQHCFRTLGLWLFRCEEKDEADNYIRSASWHALDLPIEHRVYCPWSNAKSQSGGGPEDKKKAAKDLLSGWQVLDRILKNDHYLRSTGEYKSDPVMTGGATQGFFRGDLEDDKVQEARDEEDKKRFSRLRRAKSFLETKVQKSVNKSYSKF